MANLLADLIVRFSPSPENWATEALAYVVSRSPAARLAFARALDDFGPPATGRLTFRTQAADERGARPDLIGTLAGGVAQVIIETKFWAGLTPRQPEHYLRLLPADGLLVFVAPSRRKDALWPELCKRCASEGRPLGPTVELTPEVCVAQSEDGRRLGYMSWRSVLERLQKEAVRACDAEAVADLAQLRGLTERMDGDRFLPFTGEELTSSLGTRVLQLCDLVDGASEVLVAAKDAAWDKGRSTGRQGTYYGSPLVSRGTRCRLYFSPTWWSKSGHPIGIEFRGRQLASGRPFADLFATFASRHPHRFDANDWGVWVALDLKPGVEWQTMLDDIAGQCRELFQLLVESVAEVPPFTDDGPELSPAG